MKNWLIGRILGFAGRKLDGYKTKIGGVGLILVGVTGILGMIFPDQGLPVMDIDSACAAIAAGIAALGLGHKAEKTTAAVVAARQEWVPGLCPEEEERIAMNPPPTWKGKVPGQFP